MKEVKKFQYGNYDRYYGYRNPSTEDVRLRSFRREWLENKDILDIGCNAGHVTLCIARDFNPKQIVGIDIDPKLIAFARKNIKIYSNTTHPVERQFPVSMPLMFGSIPNVTDSRFPGNVSFVQGNYVPENDEFLQMVQPEYDTILCLSVTKWIHLNWKDAGLKRFFHRIFAHLRPGGRLILEAQGWASYSKRKKLTETIAENYAAIQLYPERFGDYLLPKLAFRRAKSWSHLTMLSKVSGGQSTSTQRVILSLPHPVAVMVEKQARTAEENSPSAKCPHSQQFFRPFQLLILFNKIFFLFGRFIFASG